MTCGIDEVETGVNASVVQMTLAIDTRLVLEIFFVSGIDEVDDRLPTVEERSGRERCSEKGGDEPVSVVDGISEARRVDDRQLQLNAFLFENHRRTIDRYRSFLPLNHRRIIIAVDFTLEQCVDKRGLTQAGLT